MTAAFKHDPGAGPAPVPVTLLNQQTTAVLRRVKAGESLPITERGKVVAYLTPPPPQVTGNPTIDRWIAEGRIIPPSAPGSIFDLPPPEPLEPGEEGRRTLTDELWWDRYGDGGPPW